MNAMSLHNLQQLSGRSDYKKWAKSLKTVLDIAGAYDLLSDLATADTVPTHQLSAWKDKQRQCIGILGTTFSTLVEQLMQNEDTVAKVFARAKKEYEDEGLSALQVLWQEWTSISLANCDDIQSVGLKIIEIQEGFTRIGQEHKLPNSYLTLRLLDTLDD
jgi:hypothetical protein